ncbi:GlxA family transcriptional regulator [Alcaligenaceae bacterium CGII-47]|nr:GlxA family transcriptional regulator [Alcaligenaceae bacterium CGII-47]
MILKPDVDGTLTVSFLLLPEYAMVALLSAIEPMRVANRFAGRAVFRWQLLTETDEPVFASNQLMLQRSDSIHGVPAPRNLFICSSFHPEKYIQKSTTAWLKKITNNGAVIGAMDTGCHLLEAAGLLKNRRVTMHWEAASAFQEDHPGLEITNELFEIDRNLITCAGGTAAIDLMLHIIQADFGYDLAIRVCEQFIKSGIRQKSDKQRIDLADRLNIDHPRLLRVVEQMERNLEDPVTLSQLAGYACMSVRQLERLFRTHLKRSPAAYYMSLRLEHAQQLLKDSRLSIAEIGIACGFGSAAHFTRSYRRHFSCSPSASRSCLRLDVGDTT